MRWGGRAPGAVSASLEATIYALQQLEHSSQRSAVRVAIRARTQTPLSIEGSRHPGPARAVSTIQYSILEYSTSTRDKPTVHWARNVYCFATVRPRARRPTQPKSRDATTEYRGTERRVRNRREPLCTRDEDEEEEDVGGVAPARAPLPPSLPSSLPRDVSTARASRRAGMNRCGLWRRRIPTRQASASTSAPLSLAYCLSPLTPRPPDLRGLWALGRMSPQSDAS
ncbi:hypothetical protein C8Q76DRAFT_405578 [Earliella scabrosa]|nr:hypothetical protein C8Q76DRAFT_405578 [Earliella scabrosa]